MRAWLHSFGYAAVGLARTLRTQRNMQVHAVSALAVCIVGMAVGFPPAEGRLLLLCTAGVLAAELANTSVEATVDLASPRPHPLAQTAKDAAAGSVLVLAVAAAGLLASVLVEHWERVRTPDVVRSLTFGIPSLAALAVVLRHPRGAVAAAAGLVGVAGSGWLGLTGKDPMFLAAAGGLWVTALAARGVAPQASSPAPGPAR